MAPGAIAIHICRQKRKYFADLSSYSLRQVSTVYDPEHRTDQICSELEPRSKGRIDMGKLATKPSNL